MVVFAGPRCHMVRYFHVFRGFVVIAGSAVSDGAHIAISVLAFLRVVVVKGSFTIVFHVLNVVVTIELIGTLCTL